MTPFATDPLCDRARTWAALAPDGELSELEDQLLQAHLTRCAACSRFAVEALSIASELRAASFEPLARPVAIPTSAIRPSLDRVRAVGAGLAVAVMALGIASRAPVTNSDRRPVEAPRIGDFSADQAEQQLLRDERRQAVAVGDAFADRLARRFGDRPA